MKYALVALSLALLPGLAQAQDAPLALDLACFGQYADTETTTGTVGPIGEQARATITTNVMRPGTARVTFRGESGELAYPDGRRRMLSNVTADPHRIRAEYDRKALFRTRTWSVEIDRMTGDISVSDGSDVGFVGNCEAAPTTAKF